MSETNGAKNETIEIQKELFEQKKSKLRKYQDLIVGRSGLWTLFKYEFIITFCSALPGATGLLLRSKLYPALLGKVGKNVTFGTNVVLRHPHKIFIGDNVVIDDNVVLDAKGSDNKGLFPGWRVGYLFPHGYSHVISGTRISGYSGGR